MCIPISGEISIKYEIIVSTPLEYKGNDDRYELDTIKRLWIKYADEYCESYSMKYPIPTIVYDARELYDSNSKRGIDGNPVAVMQCMYINNSNIPTYEEFEHEIIYIATNLKRELNLLLIRVIKTDTHTLII